MDLVGVRYRRGGASIDTGFDCSGFTRHVFEMSLGLVLPRRVDDQATAPGLVTVRREDLRPGDLVFFNTLRRTFSHVGIYVGDNRFIHSPRSGRSIRTEDMSFAYWTSASPALAGRGEARGRARSNRGAVDARRLAPPMHGLGPRRRCEAQSRMADKVISVADHRYRAPRPLIPARLDAPTGILLDTMQRPLRDLRISVTDRCNFRCSYCMPKEVFDRDYTFLPQSSLLSFEEITRLAGLFVAHGVQQDPPHGRRAAAAPRPRAAGGDAGFAARRRRRSRWTSR